MTHKAKIGDTVLSRITGKQYKVSGFNENGIIVESDFGTGLLFENEYEVVKEAEPEMYLSFNKPLKIGIITNFEQGAVRTKEQAEAHINSHPNAFTYKLVPVEVEEVDVTVKKKVIV